VGPSTTCSRTPDVPKPRDFDSSGNGDFHTTEQQIRNSFFLVPELLRNPGTSLSSRVPVAASPDTLIPAAGGYLHSRWHGLMISYFGHLSHLPVAPIEWTVPVPAEETDRYRIRRACALTAVLYAILTAMYWSSRDADPGEGIDGNVSVLAANHAVIFAAHTADPAAASWGRITDRQKAWLRDWWSRVQRRLAFRGALMRTLK